MNDRMRQFLVLFFTIGQAVVGYLSNVFLTPNVGEISDSFENYFTPAGITFAVWGYLYLALIAYGIYQALPAQRERTIHRRIGGWVALGTASSAIWPVVWSQIGLYGTSTFQMTPLWITVLLIAVLTFSLAVATRQLRSLNETMSGQDRWLVALPILSYLAWASVATIANVTTLLIGLGWNPGEQGAFWSAAMIVVAALIVLAVIFDGRNRVGLVGFAAVILWALVGIYLGNNDKSALVGTTALVATGVVALFGVWRFVSLPAKSQQAIA
jgi:hypothetical protein